MEEEPMVTIKGKAGYATEPVCTFEEQPVYRFQWRLWYNLFTTPGHCFEPFQASLCVYSK